MLSSKFAAKAATGGSSTKKLYFIFTQKLLEEIQVLINVCSKLRNLRNWTLLKTFFLKLPLVGSGYVFYVMGFM